MESERASHTGAKDCDEMSPILLYVVAVIYASAAGQYIWAGRYGMALAFAAYALANVGFALDTR